MISKADGQSCSRNITCESGYCLDGKCSQLTYLGQSLHGNNAKCPQNTTEPRCQSGCCHEDLCVDAHDFCPNLEQMADGSGCFSNEQCLSENCQSGRCLPRTLNADLNQATTPLEGQCYSNRTCETGCCFEGTCHLATFCEGAFGYGA